MPGEVTEGVDIGIKVYLKDEDVSTQETSVSNNYSFYAKCYHNFYFEISSKLIKIETFKIFCLQTWVLFPVKSKYDTLDSVQRVLLMHQMLVEP